jgi:hypothetical protein
LIGRDCDELSLGKGVSQNASFIGADPYDVNTSLVLVQRIEHNLRVKQFAKNGCTQISFEGPIISLSFFYRFFTPLYHMVAYYFNKMAKRKTENFFFDREEKERMKIREWHLWEKGFNRSMPIKNRINQ